MVGILRGSLIALALVSGAATTMAQAPQQDNRQILNYRDADVRALIEDVSMLTGRTFIVDPRVSGRVTVYSNAALEPEAIFQVFLSALDVNGYAVVPGASGALRIIPDDEAAIAGDAQVNGGKGSEIITQVFKLAYMGADEANDLIRPLIGPEARVIALDGAGSIVVVDTAANIARIKRLLGEVDTDTDEVETIQLSNTLPEDMAQVARTLSSRFANSDTSRGQLNILPLPSMRALMLKGARRQLDRIAPVLRQLDADSENRDDVRVVYLKNAKADEIGPVLEQVAGAIAESEGGEAAGQARATIAQHLETNSLIISADPEMQKRLETIIERLDIPRAQVLVEAIIVEVSDTAARELGLQYIVSGGEGSEIPFSVSNYSRTAPNLLALTGALVADREFGDDAVTDSFREAAVNSLLGFNGFGLGFAGTSGDTLFGAILTALDTDQDSNILSTPSIMTMDNREASILFGQEIPVTTGEALGNNNANPFRTVDRQDVGIQLRVLPQINEGDSIRLEIQQEVSSIFGPINTTSVDLITNKREIQTTVMVKDGEVIVLGGLIEEDEQISVDKVPLLGDIPVLGRLFRTEGRSTERTNLMVFLRPKIVRNAQDVRDVTDRKYNYIRDEQRARTGDSAVRIDDVVRDLIGGRVPAEPVSEEEQP